LEHRSTKKIDEAANFVKLFGIVFGISQNSAEKRMKEHAFARQMNIIGLVSSPISDSVFTNNFSVANKKNAPVRVRGAGPGPEFLSAEPSEAGINSFSYPISSWEIVCSIG
jgi:hypothetical protein